MLAHGSLEPRCDEPALPFTGPGMAGPDSLQILQQASWSYLSGESLTLHSGKMAPGLTIAVRLRASPGKRTRADPVAGVTGELILRAQELTPFPFPAMLWHG